MASLTPLVTSDSGYCSLIDNSATENIPQPSTSKTETNGNFNAGNVISDGAHQHLGFRKVNVSIVASRLKLQLDGTSCLSEDIIHAIMTRPILTPKRQKIVKTPYVENIIEIPPNYLDKLKTYPNLLTGNGFNLTLYLKTQTYKEVVISDFMEDEIESKKHYAVVFFYRNIPPQPDNPKWTAEIYYLATATAFQYLDWCADYMFPLQVSSRLLTDEGHRKKDSKPLRGPKVHNGVRYSSPQKSLNFLYPEIVTNFGADCGKNSSVYWLPLSIFEDDLYTKPNGNCNHATCGKRRRNPANMNVKVEVGKNFFKILENLKKEDYLILCHHFSTILSKNTRTYQPNEESLCQMDFATISEADIEEDLRVHQQSLVPVEDCLEKELEIKFLKTFLPNTDPAPMESQQHLSPYSFYFVHSRTQEFLMARNFFLRYKKTNVNNIPWNEIPTYENIMSSLNTHQAYKKDMLPYQQALDLRKMRAEINEIRISYRGTKRKLFVVLRDGLDGYIFHENALYWRHKTKWWQSHQEFLASVHLKFLDLLQNNLLIPFDDQWNLRHKWLSDTHKMKLKKCVSPKKEQESPQPKKKSTRCQTAKNATQPATSKNGSTQVDASTRRSETEDWYNRSYSTADYGQFLVGDKHLETGRVELFDLMQIKDGECYLYHVKDGFDASSSRYACSQIRDAFDCIRDPSTNNEILQEYFEKLKSKNRQIFNGKLKHIEFEEFAALISKATYVYAFVDGGPKTTPAKYNIDLKSSVKSRSMKSEITTRRDLSRKSLKDWLRDTVRRTSLAEWYRCSSEVGKFKKRKSSVITFKKLSNILVNELVSIEEIANTLQEFLQKQKYVNEFCSWTPTAKFLTETCPDFTSNLKSTFENFGNEARLAEDLYRLFGEFRSAFPPKQSIIARLEILQTYNLLEGKFRICEIFVDDNTNPEEPHWKFVKRSFPHIDDIDPNPGTSQSPIKNVPIKAIGNKRKANTL